MKARIHSKFSDIGSTGRVAAALAVILAALITIGAYFVVPALVPERLIKAQIDEYVLRWTGGAYRLHDSARIEVEPGFHLIVSDPAFVPVGRGPSAPVLTADQSVASLRVLPLLFGRVEISNLVILRPEIDLGTLGKDSLNTIDQVINADVSPKPLSPLGAVTLVNGTVRFDAAAGLDELTRVDLRLSTNVETNAVAIRGGLVAGARHLRVDLQLDDLGALVSEAGTQGRLQVGVGLRQQENAQGDAVATDWEVPTTATDVLRQLASAIGLSGFGFGTMAAEGTFSVTPHNVDISDATFSLGGLELEGQLSAANDSRQVIPQLLHLPDVLVSTVSDTMEAGEGRWVDIPVNLTALDGLDANVDLSGEDLTVGDLTLDRAAVSVAVGNGIAALQLAGSRENLGDVEATLTLDYTDDQRIKLTSAGQGTDISVGKITQVLTTIGPPPLIGTAQLPEGTMETRYNLSAQGHTLGALVQGSKGSLHTRLRDGSLAGTDLVATLETLVRGRKFMTEKDGPLIPAAGRTQFDQLDARVDFASGKAIVSHIDIVGEQFGINMLGEVQLTEGKMNVGGHAKLLPQSGTTDGAGDALVNLPFGVGGTLFAPVVAAGVPTVKTAQADRYVDGR